MIVRPIVLAGACALLAGGAAAQQILRAGQVLRVHFHVTPPFNTTPDTMSLNFGIINVDQPFTTRSASLWDCDTLLGTHSDSLFGTHVGPLSLFPSNTWTTASSPYTFLNPAIVNMTSVQTGGIRGIIDFRIQTGQVTYTNGIHQISIWLGRAVGPSSTQLVSPAPIIDDVRITADLNSPMPGVAGTTNTFLVTGATPTNPVFLGFGLTCGRLPLPCPGGGFFDMLDPIAFLGTTANAAGDATFSIAVPPSVAGVRILQQAIEVNVAGSGCLTSTNLVPHTY
jgi:hypothetical protein